MKIKAVFLLWMICATLSAQQSSPRARELEKQRKTLQAEIEGTNKLLSENKRSISNVLRNLNLVVQQIDARKKLIAVLEKEIAVLNDEIRLKENQIRIMDKDLRQKKDHYAVSVRKMYAQKTNQSQLLFILSADNPAQSLRRMLYLKEYAGWRKQQAGEILIQQQKMAVEKEALQADKREKEALAYTKKNEEDRLQEEENAKKIEVADLQKNTKQLQIEVDKKRKQAASLDREIARIIAQEIAKSNKAAKADPKTERKAESKGGYAMTKEEQALSSSFVSNRGKLPFPLKGNYRIIAHYGRQQYANLKNTVYNQGGIEIKTTAGNTAKAVFDGEVISIFFLQNCQFSAIVQHGNYRTLYSYLEQVFVNPGDKVKTGQDLGKIYTDPENDATILHFEVWKEQNRDDPELWLIR